MKISLNKLKEYTKIKYKTVAEVVAGINNQLADVQGTQDLSEKYKGILVAQIVKADAHPDADKLGVFQINIGKAEPVQVVAGDKSLKVGDRVAYFPPETKVPFNPRPDMYDGIVKAAKLRGVMSNGMLASAKELDISNNHEHVLVLDTKAKPGTTFADVYDLNDTVLDVENKALTNRPECFGYIGLAREVAGVQGIQFTTPKWFDFTDKKNLKAIAKAAKLPRNPKARLSIVHKEQKLCSRYMAVVLDNIKIKDSPLWLQLELDKAGMRPLNNVVDITNYLMIITGQPTHAFDFNKVIKQDKKLTNDTPIITIRMAKEGEKLEMINGKIAELDSETPVIADSTKPILIAGIMGGLPTEVAPDTTKIILECAMYDMYSTRKTSNRLGLTSDAVTRYSKNQDPEMCEAVVYEAIKMFRELAGAEVVSKVYDSYTLPRKGRIIKISLKKANAFIGINLSAKKAAKMLGNVELEVTFDKKDSDLMYVNVPSYRQDLNIIEDIYEELARLYSFSRIPITLPTRPISPAAKNSILELQKRVRHLLSGYGATELITYNFISKATVENAGQKIESSYHLKNALSLDLTYMRQSILPNMIEKAVMNLGNSYDEVNVYELGKSHVKGVLGDDKLPYEFRTVALVNSVSDKVVDKGVGSSYYQAKKYVDNLLIDLGVDAGKVNYELFADAKLNNQPWLNVNEQIFEKNASALVSVTVSDERIYLGLLGEINAKVKSAYGLPNYSCGFELNIEQLLKVASNSFNYHELSKYPKAWRDLCFVVADKVNYSDIQNAITSVFDADDLVYNLESLDIYQKDKASGDKQLTFRLSLQSKEKPLNDKDIEYWVAKILKSVEQKTGGKLKE